jgi:hypothetical protein
MMTDDQSKTSAENGVELPPDSLPDAELPPSLADGADAAQLVAVDEAQLAELEDDLPASLEATVMDEESPLPPLPRRANYDLLGDDMDIDAALAAVASLSDVAAEREATEDAEQEAARPAAELPVFLLPTPPVVAMKRGTPASLVPALVLIVSGALLTLATTSGTEIPAVFIVFGALAAVALLMIGYWLTAGRWARGAFFLASLLTLSAGALYWLTQPGGAGVAGMPLLIVATGLALILTALISRPRTNRAFLPGLLMVVGGAIGLGFTLGLLDSSLLGFATQYAWVIPIILLVLWVLPLIFRRRS